MTPRHLATDIEPRTHTAEVAALEEAIAEVRRRLAAPDLFVTISDDYRYLLVEMTVSFAIWPSQEPRWLCYDPVTREFLED